MPLRDELKTFADIELVSNHAPVYQEKIYEHTANIEDVVSLLHERHEPSFHISDIPQDEYQSPIEFDEPSSRELARRALADRQQRIDEEQSDELIRQINEYLALLPVEKLRKAVAAVTVLVSTEI
jgi:hypothetical protein